MSSKILPRIYTQNNIARSIYLSADIKIKIRIPNYMISEMKERANAIDIPYQALMKKYIADGMKRDAHLAKK